MICDDIIKRIFIYKKYKIKIKDINTIPFLGKVQDFTIKDIESDPHGVITISICGKYNIPAHHISIDLNLDPKK